MVHNAVMMIGVVAGLLIGAPAGAEVCAQMGPTQFVDGIRYCASSVLGLQAGNDYGPENLFDGNARTAWCEGVAGVGAGQRVTISFTGAPVFRRLYIENGYGKLSKTVLPMP